MTIAEPPKLRPVVWLGNTRKNIMAFPEEVRKLIGDELQLIQFGGMPKDAKIFKGVGPGVIGKNKVYLGVPGNLVAYACKLSVDKGYDGYVAFDSKTVLVKHYQQTLGATHLRGQRMYIETKAALKLISQYFKS